MKDANNVRSSKRRRVRIGLILTLLGLLIFILGVDPGLFGLDRSPIMGFLQISVFLVGLAMICLGGFFTLNTFWNGMEKTIAADIGYRLVSTGYVIAVFTGMADIFGIGSQSFPKIPHFGIWQTAGVIAGIMIIAVGFILMIPYPENIRPSKGLQTSQRDA
jgi:hypothetical protein